jgi:hypothetical protein
VFGNGGGRGSREASKCSRRFSENFEPEILAVPSRSIAIRQYVSAIPSAKEQKVKKLVLAAAAAAAVAAPVALIPSIAGATGSAGGSSVSINQYADFNLAGAQLDVGLNVSCTGGYGTVNVTVKQEYPETTAAAVGLGVQDVVCDGRTRYVTVTIVGTLYDGGKATASATVVPLANPTADATATRQITIRAT